MKKLFTLVVATVFSVSAFSQVHCEWTAAQLPSSVFGSVDEAVAAGYCTQWGSTSYIGVPAQNLIENENIVVSLPLPYNNANTGNSKYSGYSTYAYKLIMGMSNSTRDGIDASYFVDGLEESGYLRQSLTQEYADQYDQGHVVYDAVIQVDVKSEKYGVITLSYNRGTNTSAMYVVDVTKQKMVLQNVTRNGDGNIQTHIAKFGVEPGHQYYILASESGSVELYGISYDECADKEYTTIASEDNCTDLWTAAQLPSSVFGSVDEAVAAGYCTQWGSPEFIGVPAQNLIDNDSIVVSLPLPYNNASTGKKYSGYSTYAYKLIMGMSNSTRDGIDASYFVDGLEESGYLRQSLTQEYADQYDQGHVVYDAVVQIDVPKKGEDRNDCGRVILNYNRGANNAALYVVDVTKQFMVLQCVTRCDDDAIVTNSAVFNVQPGHKYYVLASESSSVELYAIGYCSAASEKYAALSEAETSGIQNVNIVSDTTNNGAMYNLAGQRISAPVSGQIYIMNGKKYIKK